MKQTFKSLAFMLCLLVCFTGCAGSAGGNDSDSGKNGSKETTATEYTVSYVDEKGKELKSIVVNDSDSSLTLKEEDFAKTGYSVSFKDESGNALATNITILEDTKITVVYTPYTYKVKFAKDSDVTGNLPAEITCTYDQEFTLPVNDLTKAAKKADGWILSSSSTIFESGKKVSNLTSKDGEVVTLKANFKDKDFRVTFEVAENNSKSFYLDNGEKIPDDKVPANVTKYGYDFKGWYNSTDTSETIVDPKGFTVTTNVSFKAKFTAQSYKVTFVTAHGTKPADLTLSYGDDTIYLADAYNLSTGRHIADAKYKPTAPGYDFEGWYDGNNNEVISLEAKLPSTFADKTVTAKWTAWTVSFKFVKPSGAAGSMSDQSFTYGESKKLSKNMFTMTGKKFIGWATSYSATTAEYTDEQLINCAGTSLFTSNGQTVNLYPVFKTLPVSITGAEAKVPTSIDGFKLLYDATNSCIKVTSTLSGFTNDMIAVTSFDWYVDGTLISGEKASTLSIYRLEPGLHTVMAVTNALATSGTGGGMASASLVVNVSGN